MYLSPARSGAAQQAAAESGEQLSGAGVDLGRPGRDQLIPADAPLSRPMHGTPAFRQA